MSIKLDDRESSLLVDKSCLIRESREPRVRADHPPPDLLLVNWQRLRKRRGESKEEAREDRTNGGEEIGGEEEAAFSHAVTRPFKAGRTAR